jgi:Kef-type K+ transport system membrane component KefB
LEPFLLALAAIILATRLLSALAQRLGQPGVLGELIAGILLGPSLLGVVDAGDTALSALAGLGLLVLVFEIGLHTDVRALRRADRDTIVAAAVGATAPFAGGYGVAWALGLGPVASLLAGAVLTVTSIGISARLLRDRDRLDSPEGQIVLGAAVLDDLLGLVLLGVVASTVAAAGATVPGVALRIVLAPAVVALAIGAGAVAASTITRVVERLRPSGSVGLVALAFALVMAVAAAAGGSAMIIGALAAGLVLHATPRRPEVERSVTAIGHFVVPIFFALVGATLDLRAALTPRALALGGALTVVGILGKLATGLALRGFDGNRMLLGVAMIPRGEVGLIFAQVGLLGGAIGAGEFGAVLLMVIVTTAVTAPWLSAVTNVRATRSVGSAGEGLDDLVSGVRPLTPRATQPVKRNYTHE